MCVSCLNMWKEDDRQKKILRKVYIIFTIDGENIVFLKPSSQYFLHDYNN